jgi:hypothetical protein
MFKKRKKTKSWGRGESYNTREFQILNLVVDPDGGPATHSCTKITAIGTLTATPRLKVHVTEHDIVVRCELLHGRVGGKGIKAYSLVQPERDKPCLA